jgi:hypothetical protein
MYELTYPPPPRKTRAMQFRAAPRPPVDPDLRHDCGGVIADLQIASRGESSWGHNVGSGEGAVSARTYERSCVRATRF